MLALNEQYVRLFVLVYIRIRMYCCLVKMIAIAHPWATYIYMQPHSNGDGLWLWIDIDFGGIYDTLLYMFTLWRTARTFICSSAHSNLDVLLLGYERYDRNCTIVTYIYTCNHTPTARRLTTLDWYWFWWNIYDTLLLCWLWTNSTYVYLFWCAFEFGCVVYFLATMIAIAHSIAHPCAIYIYTHM